MGHEGYKAYLRNQRILRPGVLGVTAMKATDAREQNPPLTEKGRSGEEPGHVPAIEDFRTVMVQRAIFQSVASMGLPAFTIHSIVRYSGRALKDAKNRTIRTYGPIGVRPFLFPHYYYWAKSYKRFKLCFLNRCFLVQRLLCYLKLTFK